MSKLPNRIIQGDSYAARYRLPPEQGSNPWTTAELTLAYQSTREQLQKSKELNAAATIDNDALDIELTATQTKDLLAGFWKYRVRVRAADTDISATVAAGQLEVVDLTASKPDADRELLEVLQDTLQAKVSGRGDIQTYTIGDRNVSTMTIAEIRTEIEACKSRIRHQAPIRI